jgi:hypothetical protein
MALVALIGDDASISYMKRKEWPAMLLDTEFEPRPGKPELLTRLKGVIYHRRTMMIRCDLESGVMLPRGCLKIAG